MVETWKITEYLLPKIAASLSLCGSMIIIAEVHKDYISKLHSRNGISAVSRVLLSMSIGDIFFSVGWFMASWVVSQSEDVRYSYEATQTSGACKFQAFIFQFGFFASVCFNGALAFIYLFMVKYNWTGQRVTRVFRIAAAVIWIVSFIVAIVPLFLNMYHDTGGVCWLSPPPSDLPQCQDPDTFSDIPECRERIDISHILLVFQILPIWICVFVDSRIMYVIYKETKNLEANTGVRNETQTNNFFGVDNQGREPSPPEESELTDQGDDNDESAIHTVFSDEQGEDSRSLGRKQKKKKKDNVPTAKSFFGFQSTTAANNDDDDDDDDDDNADHHAKQEAPIPDRIEQVKTTQPSKPRLSWRRLAEETTPSGGSPKAFDDFGRIVHSELEPNTSTTPSPNTSNGEALPKGKVAITGSPSTTESAQIEEVFAPPRKPRFGFGLTSSRTNNTTAMSDLSAMSASRNGTGSGKRSQIVATQGLWYIAGFFFSYSVGTLSIVVFLVSDWNQQLYRASYFFTALQGAWNFVIFSKGRREMKTWIGGVAKKLIWGSCCCCCRLPKAAISYVTSSPGVSGVTPQQFAASRSRSSDGMRNFGDNNRPSKSGRNQVLSNMSTEVHANNRRAVPMVSNCSTVQHSNRNEVVPRTTTLMSIVEDFDTLDELCEEFDNLEFDNLDALCDSIEGPSSYRGRGPKELPMFGAGDVEEDESELDEEQVKSDSEGSLSTREEDIELGQRDDEIPLSGVPPTSDKLRGFDSEDEITV